MCPSYQPLVKPVPPCEPDEDIPAIPAMPDGDAAVPGEASAVPVTAARPAVSRPPRASPARLVPAARTR